MPQIHVDQLRSVVSAIYEIKHGATLDDDDDLTNDEIVMSIAVDSNITNTIHKKSILTCSKLKQEVDWGEWLTAEKVQLDSMEDLNMYDVTTYGTKGIKILQPMWTYMVKHDGRKKARNCCNGSVLKGKGIDYAHIYSSCASQIGIKLFTTIAALCSYIIIGTNATNAYAQSPPHTDPTFMCIDDQYAHWYFNKYGTHLDNKMFL
eukprot:13079439-Ditylum_brightwellii.AAC.1